MCTSKETKGHGAIKMKTKKRNLTDFLISLFINALIIYIPISLYNHFIVNLDFLSLHTLYLSIFIALINNLIGNSHYSIYDIIKRN